MYTQIAKYTAVTSLIGLGVHFFSHGYLRAENAIAQQFAATKEALISGLAEDFGFERRVELEQHTAEDLAEKEALIAGINPALARAVMHVESGGKKFAESPKGAIGLMQIMDFNFKRCGLEHYSQLWNPVQNVKCGVTILAQELKTYGGDVVKALQAYNGGSRCVGKCGESINYSREVLKRVAQDIR